MDLTYFEICALKQIVDSLEEAATLAYNSAAANRSVAKDETQNDEAREAARSEERYYTGFNNGLNMSACRLSDLLSAACEDSTRSK